jgi:hypothetical protein
MERFASQETTIDGLTVQSTPISYLRASALMARLGHHLAPLLKAITPTLAKSASAGKASAMAALLAADLDGIADALQSAFATLKSGEVESLMREMLQSTAVIDGGDRCDLKNDAGMNRAFTGRVLTGWKVAGFALKVTFADFFEAASALSPAGAPSKAASQST